MRVSLGVVTGYCENITGCDQFCVQPPVDKDNKHVDSRWFDINVLKYDESKEAKRVIVDDTDEKGAYCTPPSN